MVFLLLDDAMRGGRESRKPPQLHDVWRHYKLRNGETSVLLKVEHSKRKYLKECPMVGMHLGRCIIVVKKTDPMLAEQWRAMEEQHG